MGNNIKLEIFDDNLAVYGNSLLSILLKDRTTGKNIIWATDDYLKLGETYRSDNEISLSTVNGGSEKFIKPRITKSYEKQNNRTREKAEVFTSTWICNKQNNLVDEAWFGKKNIFNIEEDKTWITSDKKIEFPGTVNKTWKNYVDARRMEISCGEAPYLVSRYDTVTGEAIDLRSRIGLLDRKMRVINENISDEKEWLKWAERTFQSIYGFEFQGDNLLLARENLLSTFIDNIKENFKREPSINELKRIATIISWNIWQMDGLTFTIPLSENMEKYEQLCFFGNLKESEQYNMFNNIDSYCMNLKPKYCKIKNWRSNVIIEYRSLVEGRKNG